MAGVVGIEKPDYPMTEGSREDTQYDSTDNMIDGAEDIETTE